MKIIISPSKTKVETNVKGQGIPVFLEQSEEILNWLKSMNYDEFKGLLGASDKICNMEFERIRELNLKELCSYGRAAINTYSGAVFKNIGTLDMEENTFNFMNEHLRIMSAFYGMLRPEDNILPYRLDMENHRMLKEIWKPKVTAVLQKEDVVFNLASKEYGEDLLKDTPVNLVGFEFIILKGGKKRSNNMLIKKSRGQMVRFICDLKIQTLDMEAFKEFQYEGFRLSSFSENKLTYVKEIK